MHVAFFTAGQKPIKIIFLVIGSAMLLMPVIACGMGAHGQKTDAPIGLAALEDLCRLPAPCGVALPCDGRMVTIRGYVDSANIFSRQGTPNLPYEKFKISDRKGRAVEIWVRGGHNKAVFDKLARRPDDRIRVTGRVEAFNMPISGKCAQSIKVVIKDATQIQFN